MRFIGVVLVLFIINCDIRYFMSEALTNKNYHAEKPNFTKRDTESEKAELTKLEAIQPEADLKVQRVKRGLLQQTPPHLALLLPVHYSQSQRNRNLHPFDADVADAAATKIKRCKARHEVGSPNLRLPEPRLERIHYERPVYNDNLQNYPPRIRSSLCHSCRCPGNIGNKCQCHCKKYCDCGTTTERTIHVLDPSVSSALLKRAYLNRNHPDLDYEPSNIKLNWGNNGPQNLFATFTTSTERSLEKDTFSNDLVQLSNPTTEFGLLSSAEICNDEADELILRPEATSYEAKDDQHFDIVKPKPLLSYMHYFNSDPTEVSSEDSSTQSSSTEASASKLYTLNTLEPGRNQDILASILNIERKPKLDKIIVLGKPRPRKRPKKPQGVILIDKANIIPKTTYIKKFDQKVIEEKNGLKIDNDEDEDEISKEEDLEDNESTENYVSEPSIPNELLTPAKHKKHPISTQTIKTSLDDVLKQSIKSRRITIDDYNKFLDQNLLKNPIRDRTQPNGTLINQSQFTEDYLHRLNGFSSQSSTEQNTVPILSGDTPSTTNNVFIYTQQTPEQVLQSFGRTAQINYYDTIETSSDASSLYESTEIFSPFLFAEENILNKPAVEKPPTSIKLQNIDKNKSIDIVINSEELSSSVKNKSTENELLTDYNNNRKTGQKNGFENEEDTEMTNEFINSLPKNDNLTIQIANKNNTTHENSTNRLEPDLQLSSSEIHEALLGNVFNEFSDAYTTEDFQPNAASLILDDEELAPIFCTCHKFIKGNWIPVNSKPPVPFSVNLQENKHSSDSSDDQLSFSNTQIVENETNEKFSQEKVIKTSNENILIGGFDATENIQTYFKDQSENQETNQNTQHDATEIYTFDLLSSKELDVGPFLEQTEIESTQETTDQYEDLTSTLSELNISANKNGQTTENLLINNANIESNSIVNEQNSKNTVNQHSEGSLLKEFITSNEINLEPKSYVSSKIDSKINEDISLKHAESSLDIKQLLNDDVETTSVENRYLTNKDFDLKPVKNSDFTTNGFTEENVFDNTQSSSNQYESSSYINYDLINSDEKFLSQTENIHKSFDKMDNEIETMSEIVNTKFHNENIGKETTVEDLTEDMAFENDNISSLSEKIDLTTDQTETSYSFSDEMVKSDQRLSQRQFDELASTDDFQYETELNENFSKDFINTGDQTKQGNRDYFDNRNLDTEPTEFQTHMTNKPTEFEKTDIIENREFDSFLKNSNTNDFEQTTVFSSDKSEFRPNIKNFNIGNNYEQQNHDTTVQNTINGDKFQISENILDLEKNNNRIYKENIHSNDLHADSSTIWDNTKLNAEFNTEDYISVESSTVDATLVDYESAGNNNMSNNENSSESSTGQDSENVTSFDYSQNDSSAIVESKNDLYTETSTNNSDILLGITESIDLIENHKLENYDTNKFDESIDLSFESSTIHDTSIEYDSDFETSTIQENSKYDQFKDKNRNSEIGLQLDSVTKENYNKSVSSRIYQTSEIENASLDENFTIEKMLGMVEDIQATDKTYESRETPETEYAGTVPEMGYDHDKNDNLSVEESTIHAYSNKITNTNPQRYLKYESSTNYDIMTAKNEATNDKFNDVEHTSEVNLQKHDESKIHDYLYDEYSTLTNSDMLGIAELSTEIQDFIHTTEYLSSVSERTDSPASQSDQNNIRTILKNNLNFENSANQETILNYDGTTSNAFNPQYDLKFESSTLQEKIPDFEGVTESKINRTTTEYLSSVSERTNSPTSRPDPNSFRTNLKNNLNQIADYDILGMTEPSTEIQDTDNLFKNYKSPKTSDFTSKNVASSDGSSIFSEYLDYRDYTTEHSVQNNPTEIMEEDVTANNEELKFSSSDVIETVPQYIYNQDPRKIPIDPTTEYYYPVRYSGHYNIPPYVYSPHYIKEFTSEHPVNSNAYFHPLSTSYLNPPKHAYPVPAGGAPTGIPEEYREVITQKMMYSCQDSSNDCEMGDKTTENEPGTESILGITESQNDENINEEINNGRKSDLAVQNEENNQVLRPEILINTVHSIEKTVINEKDAETQSNTILPNQKIQSVSSNVYQNRLDNLQQKQSENDRGIEIVSEEASSDYSTDENTSQSSTYESSSVYEYYDSTESSTVPFIVKKQQATGIKNQQTKDNFVGQALSSKQNKLMSQIQTPSLGVLTDIDLNNNIQMSSQYLLNQIERTKQFTSPRPGAKIIILDENSKTLPKTVTEIPIDENTVSTIKRYVNANFGKIIPATEFPRVSQSSNCPYNQMLNGKMFFVGDGIKLPLIMVQTKDGDFKLRLDTSQLCNECSKKQTECSCSKYKNIDKRQSVEYGSFPEYEEDYYHDYSETKRKNTHKRKQSIDLFPFDFNDKDRQQQSSKNIKNRQVLKSEDYYTDEDYYYYDSDELEKHNSPHTERSRRVERSTLPEQEIDNLIHKNGFLKKHFDHLAEDSEEQHPLPVTENIYLTNKYINSRINRHIDHTESLQTQNDESDGNNNYINNAESYKNNYIPKISSSPEFITSTLSPNLLHKDKNPHSSKEKYPSLVTLTNYDHTIIPKPDDPKINEEKNDNLRFNLGIPNPGDALPSRGSNTNPALPNNHRSEEIRKEIERYRRIYLNSLKRHRTISSAEINRRIHYYSVSRNLNSAEVRRIFYENVHPNAESHINANENAFQRQSFQNRDNFYQPKDDIFQQNNENSYQQKNDAYLRSVDVYQPKNDQFFHPDSYRQTNGLILQNRGSMNQPRNDMFLQNYDNVYKNVPANDFAQSQNYMFPNNMNVPSYDKNEGEYDKEDSENYSTSSKHRRNRHNKRKRHYSHHSYEKPKQKVDKTDMDISSSSEERRNNKQTNPDDEFVNRKLGLVRSFVNWVRDWVTETASKTRKAFTGHK